jgi:hypothetical protein
MRRAAFLGGGAVAILLVGLALGAMLSTGVSARGLAAGHTAAPQQNGIKYCHLYEQTLAHNLGVRVSRLESANVAALETTAHQAYTDKAITQSQLQNALNHINQLRSDPCTAVANIISQKHHGGKQFAGAHQAVLTAVAGALHMQPAMLESDLASGETLPQIAASQNAKLADVNTAYLDAVHGQLSQAVSSGKITQAQANAVYSQIEQAVAHGKYPLLQPNH